MTHTVRLIAVLASLAFSACTSPTAPPAPVRAIATDTPTHAGLAPVTIGEPSRVPIFAGGQ